MNDTSPSKPRRSGVTPINRNPTGSGVPGVGGTIPGALPAGSTSSLPRLPKDKGAFDSDNISEKALGWPIVGVISRASGKVAEHTFKVYKGHDRVDEWQFHVFDRGITLQQPPSAAAGGARPPFVGPGFGGNGTFVGAGDGPRPGILNPPPGGSGWRGGGGRPGGGPGGLGFPGRLPGSGFGGQVVKPPPQPPPGGYQEPPDDPEE